MYVPGMEGLACPELGHANYQHPGRGREYFDHTLDNFSGWLIYVALECLAIDPDLWHGSIGKECLLFNRQDLKEPESSLIFRRLCSHSSIEIRHYAACLKYFLKLNPHEVPPVCPDYFIVSELATGKDEPDIAKENEDRNRQRLRESREGLLLFSLPLLFVFALFFLVPIVQEVNRTSEQHFRTVAEGSPGSYFKGQSAPRVEFSYSSSQPSALRSNSLLYNAYQQGTAFYDENEYEQAKHYLEIVSNGSPSVAADHELLCVREKLAVIYGRQGELDQANEQFRLAQEMCRLLDNEFPSSRAHTDEHRCWNFSARAAAEAEAGHDQLSKENIQFALKVGHCSIKKIEQSVEEERKKLRKEPTK